MAHFAKVVDNKVVNVIVAEQEFMDNYVDTSPGEWIQTSYNTHNGIHVLGGTPLRQNFAGVGWNYDRNADVFYAPQPHDSWTLDSDWIWNSPVVYPDDGNNYTWNENEQRWDSA
jgi:hypothetical protein